MATLEKIRNRAGVLVAFVIGFALLAFILGDLLSSGKSIFSSNQFEIAKIDGKSVSVQSYQQKVDNLAEIYKMNSQQSSLDENTLESVREQTWQQIVQEYVLEDEIDELGLAVSPEEVFDMVQGTNIHPIIRQMFTNPETGELNRAYILQFLKSLDQEGATDQKTFWLYLENEIRRERLVSKFNTLVEKGLYATTIQAREGFKAANNSVNFSFVMKRFSDISDSSITITDKDLKAYYKKNKKNFKQEASRDMEFVAFDIKASPEDDRQASVWINDISDEFKNASDNRQFVNLNSDKPFDENFYNQSELPDDYAESVFNGTTNDMFGPFRINDAYLLAKLAKIEYMPDSVKARHILIRPAAQTQIAIEKARTLADSLKTLINNGANFAELAQTYSTDGSAKEGGDLGWFRKGQMVKPFSDAAFSAEKGEMKIVETQFGVHLIQVLDKGKDEKKVQVALLERRVEPSSSTYQNLYSQASEFAGVNNTRELFEKAAAKDNLTLQQAKNIGVNDKKLAGLETPRELIKWAFEAEGGDVSKVYEFGDKFVIASVTSVKNKGYAKLDDVMDQVRLEVTKNKKAEYIKEKMEGVLSSGNDLNKLASSLNNQIQQASNVTFSSFSIPGAGIEPAVVGASVALEKNKVSKPIQGNNGVYVLKVNEINNANIPENLYMEKSRLAATYSSRAGFESFEALKTLANIEDGRSKFY